MTERDGLIGACEKAGLRLRSADRSGTQFHLRFRKDFEIRPCAPGDETAMAELVAYTLRVSNRTDYTPEYIEAIVKSHDPAFFAERAADSHFYVVRAGERIVGCGGITGYRGSVTESCLLSIFVHPDWQGRGLGKRILETLEADPFFKRARRTEVAASLTAVGFYRRLGYSFKNGVREPDPSGVVRMEKYNDHARGG